MRLRLCYTHEVRHRGFLLCASNSERLQVHPGAARQGTRKGLRAAAERRIGAWGASNAENGGENVPRWRFATTRN